MITVPRPLRVLEPADSQGGSYALLPFRFLRFDPARVLIVNDFGDYQLLPSASFEALVVHRLDPRSEVFKDLQAHHFVADKLTPGLVRVLAERFRIRKGFMADFTKLHIFVVTLRCDHSCPYCQVSRQALSSEKYDMSEEIANRAIDLMLQSPAEHLTMEFQGGEPLVTWERLAHMVERATMLATGQNRQIDFVIATNLSLIDDAKLEFCRRHDIRISTSLDGPAFIHDTNRPLPGASSYDIVTRNIGRVRDALGFQRVSALMTTTRLSLEHPEAIVDEYLRQGFRSIFLRPLRSFGFAAKTKQTTGYSAERFIEFYRRGLEHILRLNQQGVDFQEVYAKIILTRILTPYSTGYVDLQSPSSLGTGVVVYNYDGDVYASDESRMLAEMGDFRFRLGSIHDDYKAIFLSPALTSTLHASCVEALPGCADCAFQPYCGADPLHHHTVQGDVVGHRPTSDFHKINFAIIRLLFDYLLEGDADMKRILLAWVTDKSVLEIQPKGVML